MAGALDALGVGSALIDREGTIVACCETFATLVGQPMAEIVGTSGGDHVAGDDRAAGRFFMAALWRDGAPFTVVTRSRWRNDPADLFESLVVRLHGSPFALSIVRPFGCGLAPHFIKPDHAQSMGTYAADMGKQMARLTANAAMPVACDLFMAAARVAEDEGGFEPVEETAA